MECSFSKQGIHSFEYYALMPYRNPKLFSKLNWMSKSNLRKCMNVKWYERKRFKTHIKGLGTNFKTLLCATSKNNFETISFLLIYNTHSLLKTYLLLL